MRQVVCTNYSTSRTIAPLQGLIAMLLSVVAYGCQLPKLPTLPFGSTSQANYKLPAEPQVTLGMLGIREGQLIDLQELENSERRLKFSNIVETNPSQGEPPRIEVRRPDQ